MLQFVATNFQKIFPKRLWLQGIQQYVQNLGSERGLSVFVVYKNVGSFTRIQERFLP